MFRQVLAIAVVGLSALAFTPTKALAALSPQNTDPVLGAQDGMNDHVLAQTYRLSDLRIPGATSSRQTVTAWAVSSGFWNGESLDGLSVVLVQEVPETGPNRGIPTTRCYFSHLATPSQRSALLNAFAASMALSPEAVRSWRIEPAVIRLQSAGQRIIVHLGVVA